MFQDNDKKWGLKLGRLTGVLWKAAQEIPIHIYFKNVYINIYYQIMK